MGYVLVNEHHCEEPLREQTLFTLYIWEAVGMWEAVEPKEKSCKAEWPSESLWRQLLFASLHRQRKDS